MTETALAAWVEERVAKYKRLIGRVAFVPAIPKKTAGKIQRHFSAPQVVSQRVRKTAGEQITLGHSTNGSEELTPPIACLLFQSTCSSEMHLPGVLKSRYRSVV